MKFLVVASLLSIIFPTVFGIILWRKMDLRLHLFTALLVCGTLFEVGLFYIALKEDSNVWLVELYRLIEIPILIYFFVPTEKFKPTAVLILTYLSFRAVSKILQPEFTWLLLGEYLLEGFFITLMSGRYVLKLLDLNGSLSNPKFWIGCGIIFFFLTTLIVYSSSKLIQNTKTPLWIMQVLAYSLTTSNVLSNLIYSYAFLCLSKKKI